MEVSEPEIDRKLEDQGRMAYNHGEEDGDDIVEIHVEEATPISTSMSPACQVCHDLMQMFAASRERPPATTGIVLGSFEEAISTKCQRHKPLVERFVEYCQQPGQWRTQSDDLGMLFTGEQPEIAASVSKLGSVLSLVLANKSPLSTDPIRKGRIVDPMYMDLDMLKHWKDECLTSHGKRCQNPMKIWRTRPAWLVDVKKMCVVPGDNSTVGSSSFVALSYRWGSKPSVGVVPESMLDLQRPGILDDDQASGWVSQLMPPMVRHAMYLTSVLGERYLWVDSLCIVHGGSTTAEQLSLMSAFYASATVVIIATDGDAQDGIAGLKGIPKSLPRDAQQWLIPFGDDETIVARSSSPFTLIQGGPYYARGWTFQEYKMASRKIFLKDGLAHWECQRSLWHEDLVQGVELKKYIEPRLREILAGFPGLDGLANLIGNYNNLKLRYEEDALPGITGLLSVLSRSFTGGFLYGIPETFFDRALGWRPVWPHTNLTRRKTSDRPSHLKFGADLPSWSWVGWQGLVTLGEEAVRVNHRMSAISETFPITLWSTGDSPTTPPHARRPIRSGWYEQRSGWKKSAADLASPLPRGWTRHEVKTGTTSTFRDEPLLWPEGCGGYVYKHENLPDDDYGPTDTFFYPFPVPEITETTPPDMPEQTAYLFCTTQRARLWTRGDKNVDHRFFDADSSLSISMHNATGDAAGKLQLHDHDQLKRLVDASAGTDLGAQVEIVAINRVWTCGNSFNEKEERRCLPQWTLDEYTVLWIEWEGGVAYRSAVGWIERSKWEQLDLEEVDLVMG